MASSSPGKTWSETRRGRFVLSVGMFGLFVLVFWMAMKSRGMLAERAALAVDEQYLSFGEVWEDPAFIWSLPIHNGTDNDVEIAGFTKSCCSCATVEPASLTIPARGIAEVRVTLDLRSARVEPDVAARDFKVTVRPWVTRWTGMQAGWTVQGKVKRPFAIDPPLVDFEESLVRGQAFAPRSAVITCGPEVIELTAQCDSPFFAAKVKPDPHNPRRFRLEAQVRKEIPAGPFNQLFRLEGVTRDEHFKPKTVLAVRGTVVEEIHAVPSVLMFGGQRVGTIATDIVLLRSARSEAIKVESLETASPDLVVEGAQQTVQGKLIRVRQKIVKGGYHESTVRLLASFHGEAPIAIVLPVSYYGLEF